MVLLEGPTKLSKTGKNIKPWKRPKSTTIENIWNKKTLKNNSEALKSISHLKESIESIGISKGHHDEGQKRANSAIQDRTPN